MSKKLTIEREKPEFMVRVYGEPMCYNCLHCYKTRKYTLFKDGQIIKRNEHRFCKLNHVEIQAHHKCNNNHFYPKFNWLQKLILKIAHKIF